MIMFPNEVNALLGYAEEKKTKVANESITQLALILEKSSIPGGGSGIDPLFSNIVLTAEQREELILKLSKFVETRRTRVSALWALGKGNSRLCLNTLVLWSDKADSEFDRMAVIQWLNALDVNIVPASEYKYPSGFIGVLEAYSQRQDFEISDIASRLIKKISA